MKSLNNSKLASIILFFLLLWLPFVASAQKGYSITIKLSDYKDTLGYLANYYGDKIYITDTAEVNSKGIIIFDGTEPLPGGIYIFAINKTRIFEFVVNDNQVLTFETGGPDYVENMKVKGSPENELFFENMKFNALKYKEIEPLRAKLDGLKENKDSTKLITDQIRKINDEVNAYRRDIIIKYPGTFVASFFRMLQEVDVPEAPLLPDGRKDSLFAYNYYKSHFWSNIDLTDDRLLRTPVLHPKIDEYFDKIVIQHPDTIIRECDFIIARTGSSKEMFKYFVWYLTRKYETSKIMGFDAIFVHMSDAFYATDRAYWINETVKKNITDRANILRPILLGKKAPDMIMLDTNESLVSMYAIKAKYTIIFFWDTECGHCKKETPLLQKFYEDYKVKYNLEVFGVCADTNYTKMKEYIRSRDLKWINVNGPRSVTPNYHDLYDVYSTPVMYLLDENKVILAKRLLTDQLSEFIERHEKRARKSDDSWETE